MPDFDVNTDSGFTAALAGLAGSELPEERLDSLEEGDRTIANGLTTTEESAQPPRDGQGRFTPATQPEEPAEEEGEAPEEEEDAEQAPDPDPSEKQLADAQVFIGRQSAEIGELREKLARLEGRLDQAALTPQAPLPQYSADDIAERVLETSGPAVIQQLAEAGVPDGHPYYEEAFKAWVEEDPGAATSWYTRYVTALNQPEPAQQAPQDEFVSGLKAEAQLNGTIAAVAAGFEPAVWASIKDHLIPALQDDGTPQIVKDAIVSEDPAVQRQGVEALAAFARTRAITEATKTAQQEQKQETTAAKKAAQVASGSLRPVEERKPEGGQDMTSEERQEAFRQRLFKTETTAVREGLTFAK